MNIYIYVNNIFVITYLLITEVISKKTIYPQCISCFWLFSISFSKMLFMTH